ncbi:MULTISPECIES: type VI secretion system baseplate subunit TssG [unclassified Caballeronia]|uniref:type VI secretion system baseplate subunit TssG n=1 Tax=unclassified Caballeronia TaxID=2646786 RepID=UPI0028612E31|nr:MULTISPECIES: type VI secretion system baseplate subunit TssG [unclassified Caballeronia]MDR5774825.1 type VI secretion system baseplate subunit TssG [Caballeronia sp. LZ002]MDR5850261.1 type VI secretion system baseplate subunit TssG [Caballeronia sp. LZ003]
MAAQQDAACSAMTARDLSGVEPFVAALLARAPRMSFMQLCRLFEASEPNRPGFGERDTPEHEPVRFRPRPRMGFPAGEMASVEFADEGDALLAPTVRTTFMGLYGVDATMPTHYLDDIVQREEGHEAVEAFLDQFNHRLATLLYRAWKKYRYPESFCHGGTDQHSQKLLCLAGFGWGNKPARAGLPESRMLALLSLMVQRTRTPEGLAGVIALGAPGVEVRVDEFWPVAKRTEQGSPLSAKDVGAASAGSKRRGLGGGYVLGKRITYRSRAVRVTMRPRDAEQANDLLPGGWLHRDLMALVRLYIGVKADVHLRVQMSSRFVPTPAVGVLLGARAPRLGWTVVLPSEAERDIEISLGVCEALPAPGINPYLKPHVSPHAA